MSARDPTYLGYVTSVTGATVTASLTTSLASGLSIIGGETYRVAQVGSFVRIPLGYQDLYGIVVETGASSLDDPVAGVAPSERPGIRWVRIELAGEAIGERFERGLSQHPNVNDTVHIVTESDLRRIYGGAGDGQVPIGTLASSDNVIVRLSIDSIVTRHMAVIGSTGSGKSTTVASLVRSIVAPDIEGPTYAGARIILLDLHGEYATALGDVARVYSAAPGPNEYPLRVPFWALDANDLLEFVAGSLNEAHEIAFHDKINELKLATLATYPISGIDAGSLTVDTPVPFSLHKLWYDLIEIETATMAGKDRNEPQLVAAGDARTLTPPVFKPYAMGSAGPFQNPAARGIRRQLNLLRSRLLDRRFDFIFKPGPWAPALDGRVDQDIDTLLEGWLGHDKPVTILDLSSVPSAVLVRLISSILRIIYEALYWSREKTEGGVLRPALIVMEEAHRYLSSEKDKSAAEIGQRIAREGRKYGVGAMIVSQRPTEIDETMLAQCGTILAMRLSNPGDRSRVKGALPDNLAGLTELLPVLRTGEAVIVGEAARLPVRCRITPPLATHLPRSVDPDVSAAWSVKRIAEGYGRVVTSWRAQRTRAIPLTTGRTKVPPEEA